ncbi:MAG: hypothetical protein PHT54_05165 [Candidatus Nanoarchaeia archaeon]|nr:hypothetical protein [Candidatus Nanoarchaeia archaeon]
MDQKEEILDKAQRIVFNYKQNYIDKETTICQLEGLKKELTDEIIENDLIPQIELISREYNVNIRRTKKLVERTKEGAIAPYLNNNDQINLNEKGAYDQIQEILKERLEPLTHILDQFY